MTAWRRRAVALALALAIEGVLVGLLFFGFEREAPREDQAVEITLLNFPRPPEPPPQQGPMQDEPDAPPPLVPRIPRTAPSPLPAAPPLPVAGGGGGGSQREGPRVIVQEPSPRRLNLGCAGRVHDLMTPDERRRCESELARASGIVNGTGAAGELGPGVDPETAAAWNAAADRRFSRRAVEGGVPPGNSTAIGCAHGNLGGCNDDILIPLVKQKF